MRATAGFVCVVVAIFVTFVVVVVASPDGCRGRDSGGGGNDGGRN